jgi:hypothetical protein
MIEGRGALRAAGCALALAWAAPGATQQYVIPPANVSTQYAFVRQDRVRYPWGRLCWNLRQW